MHYFKHSTHTNMICNVPGYGTAWFHKKGAVNILSPAKVKQRYQVTYDSDGLNKFVVHKPNYEVHFIESVDGLYYHDLSNKELSFNIVTMEGNRRMLTRLEYERAVAARKLYAMVGCPSLADFNNMPRMNLLPDLPVSVKDINNAEFVFGPDVGALKGKTIWKTPEPVRTDYIKVPRELINLHHEVTMAADILYINKIPFLTSVSRNIKFTMTQKVNNRKKSTLLTAIKKIFKLYMSQCFVVTNTFMDREFEPLAKEF
eukprot:12569942-Ditylum_brightwellii.AAC.1